MKFSSALLAGSLIANGVLLAAFAWLPADSAPPSVSPTVAKSDRSAPIGTASTPGQAVPGSDQAWPRFATEDLPGAIARLRAAGFPPAVLRAVVAQRFEARRQALMYDQISQPYWKSRPRSPADAKTTAALNQLDREQTEMTKQLLGADSQPGSEEARVYRAQLSGNLSDEKIAGLTAIQQDYFAKQAQLHDAEGNAILQDPKLAALQKEMQDAIAKLLTPEELLDHNLRTSPTSVRLRQALTGVNVTEAEFRALYPLYQSVDDQFPLGPFSIDGSPDQMPARRAAEQQNQEQIKAILGPDRYADYQQASRPEYQQLNALVARLDLPISAAAQVASVQEDAQQSANAVRADRKLSADARTAQLNVLAQEATTKITATLGDRGFEGYKQNGGQWLNQLQPRPKPNAKAP